MIEKSIDHLVAKSSIEKVQQILNNDSENLLIKASGDARAFTDAIEAKSKMEEQKIKLDELEKAGDLSNLPKIKSIKEK